MVSGLVLGIEGFWGALLPGKNLMFAWLSGLVVGLRPAICGFGVQVGPLKWPLTQIPSHDKAPAT